MPLYIHFVKALESDLHFVKEANVGLGQPAGLPVGDSPSLFTLPAAVDGAAAPPLAAAPTHVHKISYDSRDFYTIG